MCAVSVCQTVFFFPITRLISHRPHDKTHSIGNHAAERQLQTFCWDDLHAANDESGEEWGLIGPNIKSSLSPKMRSFPFHISFFVWKCSCQTANTKCDTSLKAWFVNYRDRIVHITTLHLSAMAVCVQMDSDCNSGVDRVNWAAKKKGWLVYKG